MHHRTLIQIWIGDLTHDWRLHRWLIRLRDWNANAMLGVHYWGRFN